MLGCAMHLQSLLDMAELAQIAYACQIIPHYIGSIYDLALLRDFALLCISLVSGWRCGSQP